MWNVQPTQQVRYVRSGGCGCRKPARTVFVPAARQDSAQPYPAAAELPAGYGALPAQLPAGAGYGALPAQLPAGAGYGALPAQLPAGAGYGALPAQLPAGAGYGALPAPFAGQMFAPYPAAADDAAGGYALPSFNVQPFAPPGVITEPFKAPAPLPSYAPQPPAGYTTVAVDGGSRFPWITRPDAIVCSPGLTVGRALADTGTAVLSPAGELVSVRGVYTGSASGLGANVRLNGRLLEPDMLHQPVGPGDTIGVELYAQ